MKKINFFVYMLLLNQYFLLSIFFWADDSMSPDEVRKKVKGELDRIQRLASMERKETEGALLVEISELERKHAEQLDQMKKNHDKEKVIIIYTI